MRQNCILHPVPDNDVDAFVRDVLPHVFDLELAQCYLPHGLAKTTLDALDNIYSLTLRLTDTVEWNLAPSDVPPSMFFLYLIELRMPQIPAILMRNEHNLRIVLLRNVTLTQDKTIPQYSDLYQLALSGIGLEVLPRSVMSLSKLLHLDANHNRLAALPTDLATSFPNLLTLSLMFNSISTVPVAFLTTLPPTLNVVYLDGNPINELPLDMDFDLLLSRRVRIQGTPLCRRLKDATNNVHSLPSLEQKIALNWDAICHIDCAVGCLVEFLTDTVCQRACLTPACHYDSSKQAFDSVGITASSCFGVLTGWEQFVS